MSFFTSHPEVDVVYGDAYHIDENDHVIERYYTEPWSFERLKQVAFSVNPLSFFDAGSSEQIRPFGRNSCTIAWITNTGSGWRGGGEVCLPATGTGGFTTSSRGKNLASRVRSTAEINGMLRKQLGKVPDKWLFNYAHAVVEAYHIRRADRFRFFGLCRLYPFMLPCAGIGGYHGICSVRYSTGSEANPRFRKRNSGVLKIDFNLRECPDRTSDQAKRDDIVKPSRRKVGSINRIKDKETLIRSSSCCGHHPFIEPGDVHRGDNSECSLPGLSSDRI